MAISRPFLLALLGAALLGATVFAVNNARNGGGDSAAPVAKQAADQAAPAPADVTRAKAIAEVAKAMGDTGGTPANAGARLAKQIDDGHIDAWVGSDKI